MEGPVPETGIFGVGVAVGVVHEQLACVVHDGFLHMPSTQDKPVAQSVLMVHDALHPAAGGGVGVGVTYTISHWQFVLSVHAEFRQALPTHTRPPAQSAFTVQVLLQLDNCGVGVGVGVAVGVGVGVGVAVGVGVGVFVGVSVGVGVFPSVMLNASLHAVAAACGLVSGTVGATVLVSANC